MTMHCLNRPYQGCSAPMLLAALKRSKFICGQIISIVEIVDARSSFGLTFYSSLDISTLVARVIYICVVIKPLLPNNGCLCFRDVNRTVNVVFSRSDTSVLRPHWRTCERCSPPGQYMYLTNVITCCRPTASPLFGLRQL